MKDETTRRRILTGTAAIGADLVVPYARPASARPQLSHADHALLSLREPFERTWQAYLVALAGDDDNGPLVVGASAANRKVVEEMCGRPARTIEGLAFKAKVSLEHEDNLYEELVTSVMDDILAMAGAAKA